jgi:hypothetical protein
MLRPKLYGGQVTQFLMEPFSVVCPYCGESAEITVDEDVRGSFVQDCEVCCNPWLVRVRRTRDGAEVTINRADGSE